MSEDKPESSLRILRGTNPYSREVQGKANELICVAMLLDRARKAFGIDCEAGLGVIYDRLENNAPRIAVIAGSPDQPAHVMDHQTELLAVASIWKRGGVPFLFGVPVLCDGTAQSNQGMCYSLASRNLLSAITINQMEAHAYHGAFVIQGCDKSPFGILNALASLDVTRQSRGEAPVFATFAPAHVLPGGTLPDDLKNELLAVAQRADEKNEAAIAEDLRNTLRYILQCSSNQAFQGVLIRAAQKGILTHEQHKDFEKRLAVHTCDPQGGICAFNGTGNSSRHVIAALGMVHPALELLTEPPTYAAVDEAVAALLSVCNDPEYGVANIVAKNVENAIRVHSTMGGSTNIMIHLAACMIYAGYRFSIRDYDRIRRRLTIPDLFDYSLTEGRDIYALARQRGEGRIAGIATVLYELNRNHIPAVEEAPTMSGERWGKRLSDGQSLSADNVTENPIILSHPRRPISGIDVLAGNFFDSAVVKISGMPDSQLDEFDEKIAIVMYCENEEEAVEQLLNVRLLEELHRSTRLSREMLIIIHRHNSERRDSSLRTILGRRELIQRMIDEGVLRVAVVIAGQGPEAFGMPEMFTPMLHINHNSALKKITILISDGRYSGVSHGAAVGHVTPEAYKQGGILYLQNGDLLYLRLRKRRIDVIDPELFKDGFVQRYKGDLEKERTRLGDQRLKRMEKRRRTIDPTNYIQRITDCACGVVPLEIWERAYKRYPHPPIRPEVKEETENGEPDFAPVASPTIGTPPDAVQTTDFSTSEMDSGGNMNMIPPLEPAS